MLCTRRSTEAHQGSQAEGSHRRGTSNRQYRLFWLILPSIPNYTPGIYQPMLYRIQAEPHLFSDHRDTLKSTIVELYQITPS